MPTHTGPPATSSAPPLPTRALVLAAGLSTRIRGVAGDTPKPLLPVAGQAVLLRNLGWLAESGVREVTINLHYQADAIRAAVAQHGPAELSVHFAYEAELLGTAGTARAWLLGLGASDAVTPGSQPSLAEPLLVVYGDSLVRLDLAALAATHASSGALATLAVFDPAQHPHTGIAGSRVCVDASGRVVSFVEGTPAPTDTAAQVQSPASTTARSWVNAGVYLLAPDLFERFAFAAAPLDFGRDIFPRLLAAEEHLQGHDLGTGYCLGIDTPEALARAHELVEGRAVALA